MVKKSSYANSEFYLHEQSPHRQLQCLLWLFIRNQISNLKFCFSYSHIVKISELYFTHTHFHMQQFVPTVSHFRHSLEELVLLSTRWIWDGNHDRLRNQMEGLIMHCLPWQRQSPAHLRLSLHESRSAPRSTQQQMGGRNYVVHWGLLKDALIFRKPVCLCTEVYRTDFLPCVKSFCLHWGLGKQRHFSDGMEAY